MNKQQFYAQTANQAYEKNREANIADFELDTELSDTRHAVYHNADKNHTVLAIRGTNTDLSADSIEDLATDVTGVVFGNLTAEKRYKQAQSKLNAVKGKYGRSRIDLSGHSLGGAVATSLAERESDIAEAHVYNPGAFASQALKDVECAISSFSEHCRNRKQRVHKYTNEGDILSMASHTKGGVKKHVHRKPKKNMNAHTIKNWL